MIFYISILIIFDIFLWMSNKVEEAHFKVSPFSFCCRNIQGSKAEKDRTAKCCHCSHFTSIFV